MNVMSRLKKVGLVITAFAVAYAFSAVEAPYQVGDWANFCKGAVTHGFDDGMNTDPNKEEQKIFNDKNFHISLHVQTGSCNWDNCKASFAKGHEISNHTVSHTSDVSGMNNAQAAIKSKVPGEKCVTIAYPNCNTPGDAEVLKTHIAGRNCDGKTASTTPSNMAQISSKMFGTCSGCPNDAAGLNSFADQAASSKGWSVYCHHGIGSQSHNWAVTNLNAMKSHLEYLDGKRDVIWVETMGNVARYIKERNAASIAKKDSASGKITITVTDNLPDSIFNYPLTIRRPLPEGWTKAVVKQGTRDSTKTEDTIVEVDSKKYIMFKAIPDSGDVVISNPDIVGISRISSNFTTNSNLVKRQNSTLTIDRTQLRGADVAVTFFDLTGKVLDRHTLGINESRIALPADRISKSAFIVKISSGSKTYTQTFMPQL